MPSDQPHNRPRAALYSSVSSDLQSAASLDDQLRICAEEAAQEGPMKGRELEEIGAGLPPDVHKWLSAQAERNQSSIISEIIRAIPDAMDRQVDCTSADLWRRG